MQGVSALPKAMSEHLDTATPKAASQLLIYKNLAILLSVHPGEDIVTGEFW